MKSLRNTLLVLGLASAFCLPLEAATKAKPKKLPKMISVERLCNDPELAAMVVDRMCGNPKVRTAIAKELKQHPSFAEEFAKQNPGGGG